VASDPSVDTTGKQDITVLGTDIRHIKAAPPSLTTEPPKPLDQPIYWLSWLVPPLILMGVWIWDRRRRHLFSDIAYARAQRARHFARKRLAQARKQAQKDQDAAYATVARALTDYLGDKLDLPPAGLTHDIIQHALSNQAVLDDLIDRSLACLDWADSGRFAPVAAGRNSTELITAVEAIIAELEQAIQTT
jgi:hypothetical protein